MSRSLKKITANNAQRMLNSDWSDVAKISYIDSTDTEISAEVNGIFKQIARRWSPASNEYVIDTNPSMTFAEADLIAKGIIIRGDNGLVNTDGLYLYVSDTNDVEREYMVEAAQPDETIGIVIFILKLSITS